MKKITLDKDIKKIHFIGIGGISMSSLAEILHKSGYIVSGSDRIESKALKNLRDMGIKVTASHTNQNITDDLDLVVYTVAIKDDNEEMIEARNKNIKIIDRAEMLGIVMSAYEFPICVSGTHGKTTTTSMISEILMTASLDPSISVGGYYKNSNGTFGDSEYFVVESCEYFNSFHKFFPYVGVILNIEEDHLDFFSGIDEIMESFRKFSENVSDKGALVINKSIKNVDKIIKDLNKNVITFGTEDSDCYPKNISYDQNGFPQYDLYYKNDFVEKVKLSVMGEHNILNSLAAFSACKVLGISDDKIIEGLFNYKGTDRRFQIKGTFDDITVVDDYAHHPTEILSTLNSCKNFPCERVVCIFQPHTYTRTKALFPDLVEALSIADEVLLVDIYAAREKDDGTISSKNVLDALITKNVNSKYFADFDSCVEYLKKNSIPKDLLITMGAGDVYLIGEKLLSQKL